MINLIDINSTTGRKVYKSLCAAVIKQAVNDARERNDLGHKIHVTKYDNAQAKLFIQNIDEHYFKDILNFGYLEIDLIKKAADSDTFGVVTVPLRKGEKGLLKIRRDKIGKRHWYNNGKINKLFFPEEVPEGFVLGWVGNWGNQYSKGVK